jgi:hypothetical protein
MPNFTGQIKGRTVTQSIVSLNDTPEHQLMLSSTTATQTCSDPQFNSHHHDAWGTADLTKGHGTQHGYFANEHAHGDRSCGSYEGKVSIVNGQLSMEGTWKYTHGTGQFSGITGNGKFKGRQTSMTETEVTFEGSYQLKSGTRAA